MALIVKIGADLRNFDKEMRKLTKDVNAVGDKLKGVGTKLTAAITLPVVAIGTAATLTGMQFEEAMSKVAAISGATGSDLEALEAKAREMGANTSKSASEAAEALSYMALAGWDTKQMLDGIEPVLKLSAAGNIDLARASDLVTDSMATLGLEVQDLPKYLDILAQASKKSNTNIDTMMEAMMKSGGILANFNVPLEESAAMLGILANRGTKGAEAGTALNAIFANLTSGAGSAGKALDELGISAFDSEGNFIGLEKTMEILREKTSSLTQEQRAGYLTMIAGKEHMSSFQKIMDGLGQEYQTLKTDVSASTGALEDMYDVMTDNLAGKFNELKSAMAEIGLVIFERLQPGLTKIVELAKSLADGFNNLNPAFQSIIIAVAGAAAAIGPLLLAVGTGIILFGQMKAALAILGVGFGAIAAPVAIAIAAIIAIIAIFVLFGDEIKAFWNKYFQPIIDQMISIVVENLQPAFTEAFQTLSKIAKEVFEVIKRVYYEILQPVLKVLIAYIQNYVLPQWQLIFTAIGSVVSDVFKGIQNVWSNVLKPILNGIIDFISGVFSGNWSKAWQGIVSVFKGVFEGLKTVAKAPLNGVISVVNGFIKGLNKLSIPDWVPGVGGKGINIPLIPMLATGGNVFGNGQAIVGEAGPELLQKSGSSVKVTPLSAQEKAQGISGSVGNQQSSNRPIYLNVDGKTFARLVGPYSDLVSGTTVKLVERGLTP